jgi:hypothetical protein
MFAIFGATSDLAQRKLLPALSNLYLDGLLPKAFALVGIGRRPDGDEHYREATLQAIQQRSRRAVDPARWPRFARFLHYWQMDPSDGTAYEQLACWLAILDVSAEIRREEPGGAPDSPTEPFVALKLPIENRCWSEDLFSQRHSKRLPRQGTEIATHFKELPRRCCSAADGSRLPLNVLVLRIPPDQQVTVAGGHEESVLLLSWPVSRLGWQLGAPHPREGSVVLREGIYGRCARGSARRLCRGGPMCLYGGGVTVNTVDGGQMQLARAGWPRGRSTALPSRASRWEPFLPRCTSTSLVAASGEAALRRAGALPR